jgi:hypothetical protein
MHDLGLSQPLSNNGLQKLGRALGADYVASGDIIEISYTQNSIRARVVLEVRLTDVVSGELVNGAIQAGYSSVPPPRIHPDDEMLINQAITDAAFYAIKTINNYPLPTATILSAAVESVTLNRGSRDGI